MSISFSIKKVVTPVIFSPLIIAWLMGAAPRYKGKREACRLIVPIGGMAHIFSGSILKATTTKRSAEKSLSLPANPSSFRLEGCNTGILLAMAVSLTADSLIFNPRPEGLSGAVTTALTGNPPSIRISREGTANCGVPIKIIPGLWLAIAGS